MALTIQQLKDLVNTNLADNSNIIPLEHREVELALIDYLETLQPISTSNLPVNKGYITANDLSVGGTEVGINIATTLSDKLRFFGNISTATITSTDNYSLLTVTLQNALPNTNYVVKHSIEQIPTSVQSPLFSANILHPVFKVLSNNQFQFVIRETAAQTQAIRIHIETIGY